MKTSNKLIGLGLLILSIGAISFMIAAKSSMVDIENINDNDIIDELNSKVNDNKILTRSLGKLSTTKLDLNGNHRYILDPTSNEVTITGPKHIVSDFADIDNDKIFVATIYEEVTSKQDERNDSRVYDRILDTLYYNIGVQDAQSLLILIGNESKVTASSPLELQSLELIMQGNCHINAELNCSSLEIISSDAGHVRLTGKANNIDLFLDDNSNMECEQLSVQDANVMMRNNSRLQLKTVNNISGIVMDNASISTGNPVSRENLIVKDNANADLKSGEIRVEVGNE